MNVEDWLEGLGLGEYAGAFAENGVDLALLPELTNEDLKDLGIARLADRKAILKAIAGLSKGVDHAEAAAPAPVAGAGERRQVTVLFADISGFTRLSSELDPEETHALLNRYFEVVDSLVGSYGGAIDKHIGDNVMALFGAPVAHTNDPERAVRAACDIHEAMEDLSRELGQALQVHIGIASGQVVASGTGSEAHLEYTVTGDTVNLASRLQDQAAPGESLISEAVYRAASRVASCESRGEVSVKGLQAPVRVWALDRLMAEPVPDRLGVFVGRRAELAQFTALLEESRGQGKGHSILVRGEPGIGKTRLVEEFSRIALEMGFARHKALVLDFGVGKGQDAIRALLRSLLAIPVGGAKEVRKAAADRAVSARGLVSENDRIFLNDLLDLPQPPDLRGLYDAMDTATRNAGKQETLSRLVAAKAERAPLLIIVEDIHWAGQPILDHLASVAATVAECPALLVATSRVEGKTLDQGWLGSLRGCPLTTMELQPLRTSEALTLARDIAERNAPNIDALVERAGGNPLFLEQLAHSASDAAERELPGTLRGLVLARMDRLDEQDRRALQAASAIGQRFSLDALRHLMDDTGYGCGNLMEHRLVRPEGPNFLFAHALIQEGVYSSLLQARRKELHTRAAQWFAGQDSVLHAEHLDRAGDAEAPRAYLAAAREQAGQTRYEGALQLAIRALEIAPAADSFALRCLEGELLRNLGSIPESIGSYRQALEAADEGAGRCRALIGVAEGLRLSEDLSELLDVLSEAQALAEARSLWPELARIHQLKGGVYFIRGEIETCLEANTASLGAARDAKSPELEIQALGGLGEAEFARGRMISAYGYYDRCIELGREHGLDRVIAANLSMRGQTLLYRNEIEAALNDCREASELGARIRQPRAEMIAAIVAAYVTESDDPAASKAWATAGLEIARRLGARLFESINLAYLARAAAREGTPSEAARLVRESLAIIRDSESGMRFLGPQTLGAFVLITDDAHQRRKALKEGRDLLGRGALGHNHLWFYRDAMEVCLRTAAWNEVDDYARAFEDYTGAEPLPWSDFFIARGRVLADFGRGRRDEATLLEIGRLRDEAERIGFKDALSSLDEASSAR